VVKISNTGFTSFDESDGLATNRIASIFEDRAGSLCTAGGLGRALLLSCFDGERFHVVHPNFPATIDYFGWGHDRIVVQDRAGEWWMATGAGLVRFPHTATVEDLARLQPKVYSERDGLAGRNVFRVFEDSRGDIWVSTVEGGLSRWQTDHGQFQQYPRIFEKGQCASAFAEDRDGNVWIGLYLGGLARYRKGAFTVFGENDGVRRGHVESMYLDERGTIWAASHAGLIVVDQPAAEHPIFRRLTAADGLASDIVKTVTSDRLGRLNIGTDDGLNILDLATGAIRHYSAADGLANSYVELAYKDRHANLWFGSSAGGLSLLSSRMDLPAKAQSVWITEIRIGGMRHPVDELQCSRVTGIRLQPGQNQLAIDFGAIHLRPGSLLRYQYRLEGTDSDWSAPGQQRSVNYANLAPGKYRFQARVADAPAGSQAASVEFIVIPYLWQRWWFLTSIVATSVAVAYQVHRYRLAQALALERVRMRIATDLHDDIGASLSQIALLSEVARRQSDREARGTEPLARIGEISRELVDSMSDIVWSIHPQRDRMDDLVHRMRRFANDVFGAQGIPFEFLTLGFSGDRKLAPDARRQIYLIFKESVNNVARHAGCSGASITLTWRNGWLTLEVADDGNGRGTLCSGSATGHGLGSMKARAQHLGGELKVDSAEARGTKVTLRIPVKSLPT
jgi:signal transduction histidine kinase